ncbi:hypothetical protein X965_11320 [Morganella sp. EGD-HP17]|nr:hypothetical protein X965_11320 [Morganella sp. EGD-HP17]
MTMINYLFDCFNFKLFWIIPANHWRFFNALNYTSGIR